MTSIKGHFDGNAIVLDEPPPFTLAVGQAVRVVVEHSCRERDDLVAAATSSTEFWDNPLDDEDWNDQ